MQILAQENDHSDKPSQLQYPEHNHPNYWNTSICSPIQLKKKQGGSEELLTAATATKESGTTKASSSSTAVSGFNSTG